MREHLDDTGATDRDIEAALDENVLAIEAQEERIHILRLAIAAKGGATSQNSHYDLNVVSVNGAPLRRGPQNGPDTDNPQPEDDADDGGLYL